MCNLKFRIYSFWHTRSFVASQGFVVTAIRLSLRLERILSLGLYSSFLLLGNASHELNYWKR